MNKQDYKHHLNPYLPEKSVDIIVDWLFELNLSLSFWNHRKTKVGDFRVFPDQANRISINTSLNPYAFLLTMVHEISHARVWEKYGSKPKPHGPEWKETYIEHMLVFIQKHVFPEELEREVAYSLRSPKASVGADPNLEKALRKYDQNTDSVLYVDELEEGEYFALSGDLLLQRGPKRRTRYVCVDPRNQKKYLVAGLSECERMDIPEKILNSFERSRKAYQEQFRSLVDLKKGSIFKIRGKSYIKGKTKGKRFICEEAKTGKLYLISGDTEVELS